MQLGNLGALRVFRSRSETAAYYNRISWFYDLLAKYEESARNAGLELLKIKQGETVLDVGCGTGSSLLPLAQSVGNKGKVFGIDLSPGMLKAAEKKLCRSELWGRIQLNQGDAIKMPYPNGSIDAVFMSFTLELFDTPEIPKVLGECKRVLRAGSRIAVVAMSKKEKSGILVRIYEWIHQHFPNLVDCRPIKVSAVLEDAGFYVDEVRSFNRLLPVEVVVAFLGKKIS